MFALFLSKPWKIVLLTMVQNPVAKAGMAIVCPLRLKALSKASMSVLTTISWEDL